MVGAWFMLPQSRKRGMPDEQIYPLFTLAAIGSLVGARVAYVINHIGDYIDAPLDILLVWEGGISLLGGFFGAIFFAMPRMRREKLSFWKVMDAAAPGMALGVVVGRTPACTSCAPTPEPASTRKRCVPSASSVAGPRRSGLGGGAPVPSSVACIAR